MKSIKWYVWVNIAALVFFISMLVSSRDTPEHTAATVAPSEVVPQLVDSAPTESTLVEPSGPQWAECSLPLYPAKEAVSRRIVSTTRAEIEYKTSWVQGLDESDKIAFVARAKLWTPECRMLAINKACSPHCIYGDEYMAIIEAATDKREGKSLLSVALAINEKEVKHARVLLVDMQKFAAYAKTIVPHSANTADGRECLERMAIDVQSVNEQEDKADGRFAFAITGMVFGYARMCASCDESPIRQRNCKSMQDELTRGSKTLLNAEKELTDVRTILATKATR